MNYTKFQEFMAELVGTAILVAFGTGVCAMANLFPSSPSVVGEVIKGGYTNITIGWAVAVTLGVFASVKVSGAHLNPAVTIALAVFKMFPASKVFHYIVAQMLGGFIGGLIVFVVYYAKFMQIDPSLAFTQGVFSTFPAVAGFWPGFIDQVIGTFFLLYLIQVVVSFVPKPEESMGFPFLIGLIILGIGISFGGMHGYAINPARDLGPRLVLLVMGFKNTGFNDGVYIVPVLGPIVGGILGLLAYKVRESVLSSKK